MTVLFHRLLLTTAKMGFGARWTLPLLQYNRYFVPTFIEACLLPVQFKTRAATPRPCHKQAIHAYTVECCVLWHQLPEADPAAGHPSPSLAWQVLRTQDMNVAAQT